MKRNWIRNIIGGLSLTSALFVFQACYGTPQDFGTDVLIEGQVKSSTSGLPIEGIKVSVANQAQYVTTDLEGKFSFYTDSSYDLNVQFEDIDDEQNKAYNNKDTAITKLKEKIYLDVVLDEK